MQSLRGARIWIYVDLPPKPVLFHRNDIILLLPFRTLLRDNNHRQTLLHVKFPVSLSLVGKPKSCSEGGQANKRRGLTSPESVLSAGNTPPPHPWMEAYVPDLVLGALWYHLI